MSFEPLLFGLLLGIAAIFLIQVYRGAYEKDRPLRVGYLGVMTSLAVIFGIIESWIPDIFLPGVKLGLPNIVVLTLLVLGDKKEALIISLLRVFIVSLLRGNLFQMGGSMALAGALASYLAMLLVLLIFKKVSPIFLSCLGALFHAFAQLCVASIYFGTWGAFYYYPYMGLLSLLTGLFSGVIVVIIRKRVAFYRR